MRSTCRFSRWRGAALPVIVFGLVGCEDLLAIAAHGGGGETRAEPAKDPPPVSTDPIPVTEEPEPTATPTLAIALSDKPIPDVASALSQTRFSIATTREIYFYSIWSELEGEHTELRRFYAPSGELYYEKLIPFSTEIDEPYPFTRNVGIPHATIVQPVTPDERGNVVVRDYFGVAGTWVGEHQLVGTWRIEISLDRAKTPTLAHNFEIVP